MITQSQMLHIVNQFYQVAIHDFLIGYHFRKIENFESHIPKIAYFWCLQLNIETTKQNYNFDLVKAHLPLHVKVGEIDRWRKLFFEILESENLSLEDKTSFQEKINFFVKILKQQLIKV